MRFGGPIPVSSYLRVALPERSDTYLAPLVLKTNGIAAEMSHMQVFLCCIAVSCSEDHTLCEIVCTCVDPPLYLC